MYTNITNLSPIQKKKKKKKSYVDTVHGFTEKQLFFSFVLKSRDFGSCSLVRNKHRSSKFHYAFWKRSSYWKYFIQSGYKINIAKL